MIIDEAFDAEKLIEFLRALIKDARKKVFLILDNLRVHHSKLVRVFSPTWSYARWQLRVIWLWFALERLCPSLASSTRSAALLG